MARPPERGSALIGTTEVRELRGRIPWYGTLANHAGVVIPAVAAGFVMLAAGRASDVATNELLRSRFVAALIGGAVFLAINAGLTAIAVSLRTGQSAFERHRSATLVGSPRAS